jgi:AcrR family transcriptional regulator
MESSDARQGRLDQQHDSDAASARTAPPARSPARPGERATWRRPGGRSAHVRAAVYAAALELLVAQGYDALRIGEVARRAGVHETSIYRRWGTKAALVADALLAHAEQQVAIPDTGALRTDLIQLLGAIAANLRSPVGLAAARITGVSPETSELALARAAFWTRRFTLAGAILERGMRRGELASDVSPNFVLELLIGPLFLRALVTGTPLDDSLPATIVDAVLGGMGRRGE